MKKLNIIFALLLSLVTFVACSDDDTPGYNDGTYTKSAEFTDPDGDNSYVLMLESAANTFEVYKWSASDYGISVGRRYTIQIDKAGNDFQSPIDIATTSTLQYRFVVSEINTAVLKLGFKPEEAASIDMRIVTKAYGGEEGINLLPDFPTIYSSAINLVITTYDASTALPPLHLIGSMFGVESWNNANYTFVMFRQNPDAVDTYTGKFQAGSELKFIGNDKLGTWDGLYGSGGAGVLSTDGGAGNITDITTAGYYTVVADINNKAYTITPYDATGKTEYTTLGLIGAFNDWSTQLELTKASYDSHIWYLDDVELPDGELKFRANANWDLSWGGTTFPYGGGSGDNIPVVAGKYFVKFNDLTGQYIFYSK